MPKSWLGPGQRRYLYVTVSARMLYSMMIHLRPGALPVRLYHFISFVETSFAIQQVARLIYGLLTVIILSSSTKGV